MLHIYSLQIFVDISQTIEISIFIIVDFVSQLHPLVLLQLCVV